MKMSISWLAMSQLLRAWDTMHQSGHRGYNHGHIRLRVWRRLLRLGRVEPRQNLKSLNHLLLLQHVFVKIVRRRGKDIARTFEEEVQIPSNGFGILMLCQNDQHWSAETLSCCSRQWCTRKCPRTRATALHPAQLQTLQTSRAPRQTTPAQSSLATHPPAGPRTRETRTRPAGRRGSLQLRRRTTP